MSNGKPKSLSSGGFSSTGSLTNIIIVALVVIVLVLCAGIYILYSQSQSSSNTAQNAQQAYTALNNTYNDLSGQYSTLVTSDADLSQQYKALNVSYNNATENYNMLKNQSDSTIVKLSNFMESNPTVAYTYKIVANSSLGNNTINNVTGMDLIVTVYNVGSQDVSNVVVTCTIQSIIDNSTGQITQTIPELTSLNKDSVTFNLDNTTRVQSVYAAIT